MTGDVRPLLAALDPTLDASAPALAELDHRRLLTALLPELEEGRDFDQPDLHEYTVLDHNIAAVAALDAVLGAGDQAAQLGQALTGIDLDASLDREVGGHSLISLLRLACLVHDIAKPRTATMVDGRLRFPRHGPLGAALLHERLPALGFSHEASRFVAAMTRYHLRPGELVRNWPPTDSAVRRFAVDLDGHVLPLMLVNLADGMATRGPRYTPDHYRRHLWIVAYVVARSLAAFADDPGDDPLVNGDDLIAELGLHGGRTLGQVLTSVRDAQSAGVIVSRDEALALARTTLERLEAERR